jgi:hypothetical protein
MLGFTFLVHPMIVALFDEESDAMTIAVEYKMGRLQK